MHTIGTRRTLSTLSTCTLSSLRTRRALSSLRARCTRRTLDTLSTCTLGALHTGRTLRALGTLGTTGSHLGPHPFTIGDRGRRSNRGNHRRQCDIGRPANRHHLACRVGRPGRPCTNELDRPSIEALGHEQRPVRRVSLRELVADRTGHVVHRDVRPAIERHDGTHRVVVQFIPVTHVAHG